MIYTQSCNKSLNKPCLAFILLSGLIYISAKIIQKLQNPSAEKCFQRHWQPPFVFYLLYLKKQTAWLLSTLQPSTEIEILWVHLQLLFH